MRSLRFACFALCLGLVSGCDAPVDTAKPSPATPPPVIEKPAATEGGKMEPAPSGKMEPAPTPAPTPAPAPDKPADKPADPPK